MRLGDARWCGLSCIATEGAGELPATPQCAANGDIGLRQIGPNRPVVPDPVKSFKASPMSGFNFPLGHDYCLLHSAGNSSCKLLILPVISKGNSDVGGQN